MMQSVSPPLKVFLSYSHEDMEMKKYLEHYLISNNSELEILSDSLFTPKTESYPLAAGLNDMRSQADVFLLLISKSYITSKWVQLEVPQIMDGVEKRGAYLIPVILEPINWKHEPYAKYQALPRFGKSLRDFNNKEEVFQQIMDALVSIIQLKQNNKASQIIDIEKNTKSGMLDLSGCHLRSIPRDLLEMPWLKDLNLSNNSIKRIENLDKLQELQVLSLVKNEITEIENLETLEDLTFLDLEYNKLTRITNLEHSSKLKVLGLSSNKIQSLAGITHLKNLETLYIGHNQLKNIEELSHLPQLKRIILTNNRIESIKPLLGHIRGGLQIALNFSFDPNENGIFIKDNKTLSEPSIEVIKQGPDAILKYFEDAKTYGTKKLEILKLILVGNSKVGKTNFSEFLRGLEITKTHNSTHLLDIQNWEASFLKSESGKPMRINIFDFGGQDYYHDSHRMFYSHDTAYILLWDTSTNRYSEEIETGTEPGDITYENFPLEYWLESINYNLTNRFRHSFNREGDEEVKMSNADNTAPVLILQNKIDIEEGPLDQKVLAQKYKNIAGFFNMSLKAKRRTKVLFEVLSDYMNALNLSGRQLIEYEHKIIDNYLTHPRDFKIISLDEFWDECKSIINDNSVSFNKDNARIIAEILNAIGIVFYANQSETEGIIFTQINRLNEIIKEVMQIAKTGNDKGIFTFSQLAHIPYKEEVLKLLTNNKSIILISEQEYLVPQFLPTRPDPSVEFFLHAFTFKQVRFLYKAYFHKTLLLSLFSKYLSGTLTGTNFSVKNLPFWRNGIIISKGEGSNKQMVFVEFEKTESVGIINIKTMRPYNKNGLEREIEDTLDLLNKGWTVSKEISINGTDFFDANYLKEEVKNLRFEYSANGSVFSVNDFKHIVDFEKLPKKLFISYSSKNSEFIKRFVTHLEVLKSSGLIEPWYDRMIESGTKWDDSIRAEMRNSDIIIFLISPDFLATDYIMKTEIPLAIEQMKNENSKFFFVQLQPCGWRRTELAKYQQTGDPGVTHKEPISIGEPENDKQWDKVIDELEKKMNGK